MTLEPQAVARVTHRFAAPAERVFDAWLNPDDVRRWFAPGLGEMTRVDVDARVGGRFSFVQNRDGQDVDHIGEYLEIDRPRRLVFTWAIAGEDSDESRVVIEIEPLDSGCQLTLSHEMDPAWIEFVDQGKAAWSKMLAAMNEATKP